MNLTARLTLLSLLLTGTVSAVPSPWTQLKVGMSATRTASLLGDPLLRNHGHGFETWTYDEGAEVVIYAGSKLVGWTAPTSLVLPVRSQDVWRNRPAGVYYATMHAALPRPEKPAPKTRPVAAPLPAEDSTYESRLRG